MSDNASYHAPDLPSGPGPDRPPLPLSARRSELGRFVRLSDSLASRYARRSGPTLVREIALARENVSVPESITLAVRHDRRRRGLSQRAYAMARGWTRSLVVRLESEPQSMRLGVVLDCLEGTGFALRLVHDPGSADPDTTATAALAEACGGEVDHEISDDSPGLAPAGPRTLRLVDPETWPAGELLGRAADGRRLAGHRRIRRAEAPWWFARSYLCWASPPDGPDWTTGRTWPPTD